MADMRALMQNPAFIMGARMMAANQGRGTAAGPAFGQAVMGAAGDLANIEKASADASYRNRMLELQEGRAEQAEREFQTKEERLAGKPKPVKEDDKVIGYTYGGRFVQKPKINPMDLMMMQMMGGGMPTTGLPPATQTTAPQTALDYLQQNPGALPQFKQKYGYDPTK